jgi:hypothetical protein
VTFPTVSIGLDEADDQLRLLAAWLRDEDALRGRVRLVEQPIAPGQMGGVLDAVEVVLTSGTASTLVTSVFAWLGHRRAAGRVRLKVHTDGRSVELTCGSADDAQTVIASLDKILNNG